MKKLKDEEKTGQKLIVVKKEIQEGKEYYIKRGKEIEEWSGMNGGREVRK